VIVDVGEGSRPMKRETVLLGAIAAMMVRRSGRESGEPAIPDSSGEGDDAARWGGDGTERASNEGPTR
jgi:hypothetical protein